MIAQDARERQRPVSNKRPRICLIVLIDGQNLICTPCGKKATMVALDRKTGQQVWASQPLGQGSSFCSPLLIERGRQRIIVSMTETAVVAFSASDGKLLWQHPYANSYKNHPITPVYDNGLLYITSGYGKGAIGLALADGRLYIRHGDALMCYDIAR